MHAAEDTCKVLSVRDPASLWAAGPSPPLREECIWE